MRIAYITLHWPRTISSSIGKKIISQIHQWQSRGHSVEYFSHLHPPEMSEQLINSQSSYYKKNKFFLITELNRMVAASRLLRGVRKFNPDVIYLRWGMYVHPMYKLFKIAPVIVEINTNDVEEHKLLGSVLDFYNRWTRSILLGNATGLVFTSRELSEEFIFAKFNKPHTVITNGIDLDHTPYFPAPNNTPPHLVFIGSPGMPWHGVDKLIPFAQDFPDIIVDIVGYEAPQDGSSIPSNLIYHGFQKGEEFEALLSNADAAIGSISLHLNNMSEASPLKVRDCAARGIPCILPFKDTDLYDLKCPEFLTIPNSPNNIAISKDEIHDFILAMRGKRLSRLKIKKRIDLKEKEKQRVNFFQEFLE